ncbi:hypothetical protein [Nocardia heshunensis]
MELTRAELRRGQRAARRAALDSRQSFTLTKRRQYRRYRTTAGESYLDWPRWKAEYLRTYNSGVSVEPASGEGDAGTLSGFGPI